MKRLILVAMLVAGCGGTEVVSAVGGWDTSLQTQTGTATLAVFIAQDATGHLTGTATFNNESGALDGNINGSENAYIVLRFPNDAIVMQMTGLPDRMFGSVYVNGTAGVGVEFARH